VEVTSDLGTYYFRQYQDGYPQVIGVLQAEEANLLHARRLALQHGWPDLTIGPMQGLRVLYDHTGRNTEWQRLVTELIPVLTDPTTDGPQPSLDHQWAILTSYQVRIASQARDWNTAQQLQNTRITYRRQQATEALATPPDQLTNLQRNQIRNLGTALHELGQILREQDDPNCLQPYQEATGLFQRISDQRAEAYSAANLGHAYKDIAALRDLDQAQHWYQHARDLLGEDDTLSRARITGDLGNIAYEHFRDARDAGALVEQLVQYLNDAADAQQQKLDLLPPDEINEHASAHLQLGNIYSDAGHADRALDHYTKAIHYDEQQDNRYGAGQTRYNAAIALASAGRRDDALLYAHAALNDFQALGPGAATQADQTRQLIGFLEQESVSDDGNTASDTD
jgi:tetratricopeptide (TPR) repeat protein